MANFLKNKKVDFSVKKYHKNLALALFLIISLYLCGIFFWGTISNWIIATPVLKDIYKIVMQEFESRSIFGLILITFFGSLFFIGFPAELVFLIYARIGYNLIFISFVMILFTLIAQILNYGIGYFIEKKLLEKYIKENKKEFLYSLKKYDLLFIVVLNILPLPADILSVVLGMAKYDFKKTLIFTAIGKALKFLFLIFIFFLINLI